VGDFPIWNNFPIWNQFGIQFGTSNHLNLDKISGSGYIPKMQPN